MKPGNDRRRTLPALLLAVALLGCDSTPRGVLVGPGDPLPSVSLAPMPNADGSSLPDGRPLLINVWAPWCAPCVEEMPSLQRLADRLADRGLAVVGVTAADDVYLADELLRRLDIRFPNFVDHRGQLAELTLQAGAYPGTLVVDADGVVKERVIGARDWSSEEMVAKVLSLTGIGQ